MSSSKAQLILLACAAALPSRPDLATRLQRIALQVNDPVLEPIDDTETEVILDTDAPDANPVEIQHPNRIIQDRKLFFPQRELLRG